VRTFEELLDQTVNRPKRNCYWSLRELLSAIENLALHYNSDPAGSDPDMLHVALECRIAINSLRGAASARR
jgi:hypothetical protein